MRSSWPIALGFVAVGAAAYWYDAKNEAAAATPGDAPAAVVEASAGDVARVAGDVGAGAGVAAAGHVATAPSDGARISAR